METAKQTLTTRHKVPWPTHESVLKTWKSDPPIHPKSPRYRAYDFEVEGKYSLFESVVNVFRERGWLDAPPPDYKWAVLTVFYKAPKDARDYFAACTTSDSAEQEQEAAPVMDHEG